MRETRARARPPIPAGPLREPSDDQAARIVIGVLVDLPAEAPTVRDLARLCRALLPMLARMPPRWRGDIVLRYEGEGALPRIYRTVPDYRLWDDLVGPWDDPANPEDGPPS